MRVSLPPKIHEAIYLFAIAILIIGLPVSKFLMSISQIILLVNWLWEGDLKNKFRLFFRNTPALVLSSLLLLHAIGLVYSDDLTYGFKDIRIKLPLLLLPLIFASSKPISKDLFRSFLHLFLGSLCVASIISILILTDTLIHRKVVDIRDTSIFISHIRFGLLVCLGVFITLYLFITTNQTFLKWIYGIYVTWLLVFLVILESMTGLSALFITIFMLIMIKGLLPQSKGLRWTRLILGISALLVMIYFYKMFSQVHKCNPVNKYTLHERTALGNLYQHDTTNHQVENGNLVWINYSVKEMEESWNQRSSIKYFDKDLKGNALAATLIRFLTSKGVTKDAAAINALTPEEVQAVERGEANANYQNISSLRGRIHEILWEIEEYRKTGDANGHSITQRFEYWKTAYGIVKNNLLFGVGAGDVEQAFIQQYEKSNSTLLPKWRLRAHNQYFSIAVGMGIIGFIWFLITLFYPMFRLGMQSNYLYMAFFCIALVSFFTEDTLETQAGVTFYAFFNSFFLFLQPRETKES